MQPSLIETHIPSKQVFPLAQSLLLPQNTSTSLQTLLLQILPGLHCELLVHEVVDGRHITKVELQYEPALQSLLLRQLGFIGMHIPNMQISPSSHCELTEHEDCVSLHIPESQT